MTRVVTEATRGIDLPFGVNVLRNDGEAALAIAAATGAAFVRINVLVGAMVTDQGVIEGDAAGVMRRRAQLCPEVLVFADHLVKHAVPLAPFDEDQLAKDLRLRAFADAVVVSGMETGAAADPSRLERLRKIIDAPLVIGSGLTEANADQYSGMADAAIVGTSVKENGDVDRPVDAERLRRVVAAFRK
jgi:membrane complex biogenesis BtpA family protein